MAIDIAHIKREAKEAQQMYSGFHKAFDGLAPRKNSLEKHDEVKRLVELKSRKPVVRKQHSLNVDLEVDETKPKEQEDGAAEQV